MAHGLHIQGIRVQFQAGAKDFSLLLSGHTGSAVYPTSCPMDTRDFSQEQNGQGMKLITHFHLVLRLRMLGALLPFHHASPWHGLSILNLI
jgi:hypothetical protein